VTTPLEAWALQLFYELHDDAEARLTDAEREIRSAAPTDQMRGRALVAALWPIHDRLERITIEFRARMTREDLAEHLGEDEEEEAPLGRVTWREKAVAFGIAALIVVSAAVLWSYVLQPLLPRAFTPEPTKVVSTADGPGVHEFRAYPGAPPGACSVETGGCRMSWSPTCSIVWDVGGRELYRNPPGCTEQ
jgi:hypothetical protein